MLIDILEEPGRHHFSREPHLIFVVLGAVQAGLERVQPEYYTCECGHTLTPEELDRGDEAKTQGSTSWRDGGRKKCPECEEYPSIGREQFFRSRGYEAQPKSEIKSITPSQREAALDEANHSCVLCENEAEYVKRIIPPRYGGSRQQENLAPLCEHHHEDFGHMFVDILAPKEWYLIRGISWESYTQNLLAGLDGDGSRDVVQHLEALMEEAPYENPYPYITDQGEPLG